MTVLLVIAEWRGWKAVAGDMDPPGTPFSDNLQATLRQPKHVKQTKHRRSRASSDRQNKYS
jgi:hypothetical protein